MFSLMSQFKNFLFSSKLSILVLVPLFLLSGCARYSAAPLKHQGHRTVKAAATQDITFKTMVFTKQDCKTYLGRNVLGKGYQPVQISIENNTKNRYEFARENFSFRTESFEEVAPTVYTSTMGRVVGYGLASFVLPILVIPAMVDGIKSGQANDKLDKDFARKSLHDQIIEPYAVLDGIIFVPTKEFDKSFTLKLIDVESREEHLLSAPTMQIIFK